jgi:hypothetical protein
MKYSWKMCGKCGWTNPQFWLSDDVTVFVKMGKSSGILPRYVKIDGEVRELIPARTHRQRRKFVANKRNRKTRKI